MSQYGSGTSPDDFIIADEELPSNSSQPQPQPANQNAAPQPQTTSGGVNLFWTPKVDLSSAFTPFVTSLNFQQTNTIRERQYTGGDTLDEPVWQTLKRDLSQIGRRLAIVVWPAQLQQLAKTHQLGLINLATSNGIRLPSLILNATRPVPEDEDEDESNLEGNSSAVTALDWDLWGPLIFSLGYSVTMGLAAPNSQTNSVFSGTFTFIWLFYLVVGINIQMLGGSISFLSAISATGYSMFPIVLGAVVSTLFVRWKLVRLAIIAVLDLWSVYAADMSLRCLGVLPGRVFLAIYPVALMYAVMSWLVVIT